MAKQNQQLTALQEINDQIAQLRKRNKARVQRGRSYLFWERNLDEWFHYNNILKEERLSYAIDQLRGNAFKWWVQEEDDRWFYKEPAIKTWRDLKEVMRDEFSPELTSSKIRKIYPRRYLTHVSKEKPEPVIVQVKAKVSPILDKSVNESSTTCMSHLSLSKNVKTGPEVQKETNSTSLLRSKVVHDLSPRDKEILNTNKEEPTSQGTKEHEFKGEEPPGATPVMDHKMVQDTMQSMLFKEAKPILKVSHQGRINESYKLIEVPKKEPDHKLSHEFTPKWKPKSEQSIVQVPKPMSVEIISGCQEESFKEIPPDNLMLLGESTPRKIRNVATQTLKDHPLQKR
ncbi:uncharacterized protein LOC117131558, partial [Brassica rapa]|uniref:uncharacterized protein LOC117131558 n=1 Tax=Brassica campestris TaxID=3711 RepID=UPI00142E83BC